MNIIRTWVKLGEFGACTLGQFEGSHVGWGDNWVFQKKVKFFFAHPGNG